MTVPRWISLSVVKRSLSLMCALWLMLLAATLVCTGLSVRALGAAFFAWAGGIITARVIVLRERQVWAKKMREQSQLFTAILNDQTPYQVPMRMEWEHEGQSHWVGTLASSMHHSFRVPK